MDFVKEVFESWGQRIRSPFFGSFIISFLISNWTPVYFVVFSEVAADIRINYFWANTTLASLLWWPLALSVAYILIGPWIGFVGTWWAKWPKSFQHNIEDVEQTTREIFKTKELIRLEDSKLELIEKRVETERSQVELDSIVDENRSAKVDDVASPESASGESLSNSPGHRKTESLDIVQRELGNKELVEALLNAAAGAKNGKVEINDLNVMRSRTNSTPEILFQLESHRQRLEVIDLIEKMRDFGLVQANRVDAFTIVSRGYEYIDFVSSKQLSKSK